ncbi:VCBS repeat-containing protein [Oculatella sp. FACHB-28]|uniref:FG-GAP-like repeat-containing protein n=1 Tax=Oculatella sp. FACHB-28 TaxID=2692845 RepID=UPI001689C9A3|nr:FG-GAP-like repeat-containing protein [Oculatella sp. FACHB-28]MBD2058096.1 VCBS repeat-containing protein [Oculatella sp. FACHB-28]
MSQHNSETFSVSAASELSNQTTSNLTQDWKYSVFGNGIGSSGLITADIDNDGITEIIAGGSLTTFGTNDFWYVLDPISNPNGYNRQWTSSLYPDKVSAIAAFDTDADGIYSIFTGLGNGDVAIYDGSSLQSIKTLNPSNSAIHHILYADANNDSIKDIVIADDNHIYIYNASSLALDLQLNYASTDFEIGNVDSDAANEIVLSSGLVLEVNGSNTSVQWDYAGGDFGQSVELSDVDADGIQEIIGAAPWNYITVFDADIQSPKWQITTRQDIDALLVTDIDNDGVDEILYGDGQFGKIYAYDVISRTEQWAIDNPEHGVTNIAVVDVDGDGTLELFWGSGATSTGPDHLYVHDISTQSLEWKSQHVDGPFHAMDIGDVDSDGQLEIVFASLRSNSGYGDGMVAVWDAQSHRPEWDQTNLFGGTAWTGIHDVQIGDVNNDGTQEIVVATDRLYDGAIYVIDGTTKEIRHSYFYDDGASIRSLAIADIDNDGTTEIIAGGSREHTGAPGVYTYILDGATGAVEWNSINLGDYWSAVSEIEVGNLDSDATQEIVAVNNHLFVFDGVTHQQWQSSFSGVSSVHLYDPDQDGTQEILVGLNDGQVLAIDGQTYQTVDNFQISSTAITGLQTSDVDKDGDIELVYSNGTSVGIYSFEQSATIWQSDPLGTSVGNTNSLLVADTDGDRRVEIIVGTNYTVVEFDVLIPPRLVQPFADLTTNTVSEFTLQISDYFNEIDAGDTLTYSANGLPDGLEIDAGAGLIDGVATAAGQYDITVTATDNTGLSTSDTFELTVYNLIRLTRFDDTATGTRSPDHIEALAGSDRVSGRLGDDLINGGAGNDHLLGAAGNDSLNGGRHNDFLSGGAGQDRLKGGIGQDVMKGGLNSDIFVLQSRSGTDKIIDFENGLDFLGLSNGLKYEDLTITQLRNQVLISDINGAIAQLRGISARAITQADFVAL